MDRKVVSIGKARDKKDWRDFTPDDAKREIKSIIWQIRNLQERIRRSDDVYWNTRGTWDLRVAGRIGVAVRALWWAHRTIFELETKVYKQLRRSKWDG